MKAQRQTTLRLAVGTLGAVVMLAIPTALAQRGDSPQQAATDDVARRIAELMDDYQALGQFQGAVLVANDQGVIYRSAYGMADIGFGVANTPETKFRIASHGKQFSAALAMLLVEEGKLDLDLPISTYTSAIGPAIGDRVTTRQLLGHTSGMPRVLSEWERTSYRNPYTLEEIIAQASELELDSEPGAQFTYSNLGFNIVGAIIESITGDPYETVLRERILDPLGLTDTGLVKHSEVIEHMATNYNRLPWSEFVRAPYMDESFAIGAGGMYSTVDDMLRWHEALFGDELLSAASREEMFKPGLGASGFGCGVGAYGTSDGRTGTLVYGMGGTSGAASVTFRLVEDQVTIIALANIRNVPQGQLASNITNAVVGVPVNQVMAYRLPGLMEALFAEGMDVALQTGPESMPSESVINNLGYQLLGIGRVEQAELVLRFNARKFEQSWNAHDSHAEALLAIDKVDAAIEAYGRSLELNPDNTNATEALVRLAAVPDESR